MLGRAGIHTGPKIYFRFAPAAHRGLTGDAVE